jgi:threonyl-tRNA synthetase
LVSEPAIENGFYYDIDLGEGKMLTEADLPRIESKMLELARKKSGFVRREVTKTEALQYLRKEMTNTTGIDQ